MYVPLTLGSNGRVQRQCYTNRCQCDILRKARSAHFPLPPISRACLAQNRREPNGPDSKPVDGKSVKLPAGVSGRPLTLSLNALTSRDQNQDCGRNWLRRSAIDV